MVCVSTVLNTHYYAVISPYDSGSQVELAQGVCRLRV